VQLSEHFTLEELIESDEATRKGISNIPDIPTRVNLQRLAMKLEEVRALFNAPISVSSGFRSNDLNKLVGGQLNSQHVYGCAADFRIKGFPIADVMRTIVESDIKYDQLIMEYDRWIHISVPVYSQSHPRMQKLIIDNKGKRNYG
jgi:zinc D-Ala-D-Ala carboxypeptidase